MEAKAHPPTPKKLRDARRRGETVHSADLASAAVFVVLVGSAWFLPGVVIELFRALWMQACDPALWAQAESRWIDVGRHATAVLLLVSMPLCALAALTGAFGSFVQVGGLAAWSRLQPDARRLNPGTGLQRLFSLDSLIDLAKMICKVLLLCAMLYAVLYGSLDTASRIGHLAPAGQLAAAGHVLMSMLGGAAVIFVAMAPLDYLHRHFQFMKQQRMSFDEVVREQQETEGSPLNQQRRRSVQLEAAFHSVADRVGASTMVVRSLDLAVALQYLAIDTPALVMAVGRGSVAAQIHQLAAARSLYIETNAVLAERLARDVRPDQPVPPALMAAMRQVWNHARGEA